MSNETAEPLVTYEVIDRVARVGLNRPNVRNALSLPLLRELDEAFARAAADDDVKVIVLAGAGEAFSSGHDLGTPEHNAALAEFAGDATVVETAFEYNHQFFLEYSLRWRDLPKPTIAQVHGWCMFGAWMLVSAMDLIVASDNARFMTGYLQFFTLPYDIGVRQAKEMMFLPRQISAAKAHELGFVSRVVARDELDAETMTIAGEIARMPGFYLRLAKLSTNLVQDAAGFRTAVTAATSQQLMTYLDEVERTARLGAAGRAGADSADVQAGASAEDGRPEGDGQPGGAGVGPGGREKRRPIVDWIMSQDDDG